jgi:putative DNA primase/helicase
MGVYRPMNNQTLREYANSLSYTLPSNINYNTMMRFSAPNKPKTNKSAWLFVGDNCEYAVIGNWITGEQFNWFANQKKLSSDEKATLSRKIKRQHLSYLKEKSEAQASVAKMLVNMILQAKVAKFNHGYLARKKIKPFNTKSFSYFQGMHDALAVPIYGTDNVFDKKIQSLQLISPEGEKRFVKDGKVEGGYYVLQTPSDFSEITICEGFATGATIAEIYAPNSMVICSFTANNLLAVAKYFRKKYPAVKITIASDNDHLSDMNIGKIKAQQAASYIGGCISLPEFKPNEQGSDWNDYYLLNQFEAAG